MKKWRELEEEGADESGRLRADSDVTEVPGSDASMTKMATDHSISNRYALRPSEDDLDSFDTFEDVDLKGVVRSLRNAMIIFISLGVGLLLGSAVFTQPHESGENISTETPTVSRIPFSSTNSPSRYFDENSPISELEDPRFGSEKYSVPEKTVKIWRQQEQLKEQLKPTFLQYYAKNEQNSKFVEQVCEVFPNPPARYLFPPKTYGSKAKLTDADRLRHIRQYRYALLEYYHVEKQDSSGKFYVNGPEREMLLSRIASMFQQKFLSSSSKLVVGTMGTSVLSGQDNCYTYTYSPLLERSLSHILAAWPMKVEVRGMGQNGDNGPNMDNQMLCGPFLVGQIDSLHLWYPMIPNSEAVLKRAFVYKLMRDNGLQHIHMIASDSAFYMTSWLQAGFVSTNTRLLNDNDWAPKHFWGRQNDGLCHSVTREGAVAVLYQNWHFGPIGFQVYVDQVIALYLDAIEVALVSMITSRKPTLEVPVLNTLAVEPMPNCQKHASDNTRTTLAIHKYLCAPNGILRTKFYSACGLRPAFIEGSDIGTDVFEPGKTSRALPIIQGPDVVDWSWKQSKPASNVHSASEQNEGNYKSRPECSSFPDIGFSIETVASKGHSTAWLPLRINQVAVNALTGAQRIHVYVCTGFRDSGFTGFDNITMVFAVDGKEWGSGLHGGSKEDCVRANQPNGLPTPTEGTVLGIRFVADNAKTTLPPIRISNLVLLGQDETETAVPSTIFRTPTSLPAPSIQVTGISESPTYDENDPNKPTVVPHPGDDGEDEPTVVPHPGDTDDGNSRRRRRRRVERVPRASPLSHDE